MKFKLWSNVTLPKVIINELAYKQYCYLVNRVAPNEVQWWATVEQTEDGNYYVDDIFVPGQVVTQTTVNSESSKIAKGMGIDFINRLKEKCKDDNMPGGFNTELFNKKSRSMNAWCHSHPFSREMPSPSNVDVNNFENIVRGLQEKNANVPAAMLIFSAGCKEIYAEVYDPTNPFGTYIIKAVVEQSTLDTTELDKIISTVITVQTPKVQIINKIPKKKSDTKPISPSVDWLEEYIKLLLNNPEDPDNAILLHDEITSICTSLNISVKEFYNGLYDIENLYNFSACQLNYEHEYTSLLMDKAKNKELDVEDIKEIIEIIALKNTDRLIDNIAEKEYCYERCFF